MTGQTILTALVLVVSSNPTDWSHSGYSLSVKEHGSKDQWRVVVNNQLLNSTLIDELCSDTIFAIKLSAHNVKGEGPAVYGAFPTLEPMVPVQMVPVEVVSAFRDEVTLRWTPLVGLDKELRGAPLSRYTVFLCTETDGNSLSELTELCKPEPEDTQCTVSLPSGVPLAFAVASWNRVGCGEPSDLTIFSPIVPDEMEPVSLIVEDSDWQCMVVQFSMPFSLGAPIDHLMLRWCPEASDGDTWQELQIKATDRQATIRGVECPTPYMVTIAAVNAAGEGLSGLTVLTPPPSVPTACSMFQIAVAIDEVQPYHPTLHAKLIHFISLHRILHFAASVLW